MFFNSKLSAQDINCGLNLWNLGKRDTFPVIKIIYQVKIWIFTLMLQVTMVLRKGVIMNGFLVSGQQSNFFPCVCLLKNYLPLL